MKFEGTITPAKIMAVIVFFGGGYLALQLNSVQLGLAAIGFSSGVYLGRKWIAQQMIKAKNGTTRKDS